MKQHTARLGASLGAFGFLVLFSACGGPVVVVEPIVVSTNITAPTTWLPNTAIDCDYVVSANKEIEIQAALNIQAGTKICFATNAGLKVTSTGSLTAIGTPANRVVFTGNTASKGFWKGLAFRSNNPANEIAYGDVQFAGSTDNFCCDYFVGANITAAVVVGSNASANANLKLSNTSVSNSNGFGLYVFNNGRLDGFASNRFEQNTKAPVSLPIAQMGKLDAASVYSGGANPNGDNVVVVNQMPVADTNINQTVPKLDVPYFVAAGDPNSELEYAGALTLAAGVRWQFEANTGLKITSTGSLNAVGGASDPVVFTGRVATKGHWKGLAIRSNNPANRLERVVVEYAGNNDTFCCDYFVGAGISAGVIVGANSVSNATLALVNSTVRDNGNHGVYVFSGGNTVSASGNTYSNNDSGNNPVALP